MNRDFAPVETLLRDWSRTESIRKPENKKAKYDVVVFSNTRWDSVFQRPQHIFSRIGLDNKVLFVEAPIAFKESERNTAEIQHVNGVTVLKPRVNTIDQIGMILPEYIANSIIPVVWFCSAEFSGMLHRLRVEKVVYDCTDVATMGTANNSEMMLQERFLLSKADVVFAGGKSLYEAKHRQHDNAYCFPNSVERKHFEKALVEASIPDDLAAIPGPRVGYCGVIDHRIDMDLLREAASRLPDVSFVMVGPLDKVTGIELPVMKNIHYLGMKPYSLLPEYVAAFDVAMMPFVLNGNTQFAGPENILDYMAARRPVVSTALYDVVRDYSDCVAIADDAEEFTTCIQNMLTYTEEETKEMCRSYERIITSTSWDKTVEQMYIILQNV